jgi:cysteine synthase A
LSRALAVTQRPSAAGQTIVVILPDTGDRYITTALLEQSE